MAENAYSAQIPSDLSILEHLDFAESALSAAAALARATDDHVDKVRTFLTRTKGQSSAIENMYDAEILLGEINDKIGLAVAHMRRVHLIHGEA